MENNPKESVGIAEPSLSEKRDDIGIVSPHDERVIHEKRHIFPFPFLLIPLFVLLFLFATAVLAQEQIHGLIAQITKPKPITQSSKVLPVDIQQAIETEAKQQIAQQKATALIATSTSGRSTNQGQNGPTSISNNVVVVSAQTSQGSSFILNIIYPFQLLISVNSRDKAKVRLAHIDREIQEVQALLTNGLSDSAVNQAVSIIQNIGQETGEIIADKQVQTDREILTLQIEQYTRLQLTLQKIEDTLPIDAYLKVETARQKYIVPTAIAAINAAPNLDIIHTISTKQIQSIVGKDFGELKTIEILTDLQNGLTHQAQQKLQGLQKQVTLQFEKRMLTFPSSERIRKLQNYIKLSYGNSLNQAESFEQMKYFLTDREMILGADSLKELALQKLENRIFQIQNQSELNAFLELSFRNPSDLKILAQMKLDVLASNDESKKKYIVDFENNSLDKIIAVFGNTKNLQSFFAQSATPSVDIVDVSVITQLATTLQNAPQVSGEVKSAMENIKEKTLQNFVAEIAKTDFTTAAKVSYNPVSQNADVRILLPAPQAILLLEEVRSEVSGADKLVIDIAQKAESNILVDYLLTQVNDPQIFQEYQNTIATNPEVKKILTSDTPQSFFTTLDQKAKILDDQRKANNQQLYETIQQITQSIFITPDNQIAKDEQKLPETIQQEIQTLKNELPDRSIPQLTIPEDVKLSAVPTLPSDVQDALITAAKEEINSQKQSNQTKLDISVEAKDLGLSIPVILPDNPLYPLKNIIREIPILLTTDPIQKAEELIKIDNEKTIEAAKLVEESQSIVSIGIALNVLKSVKKDFDILKQNVDQVKKVEQTEPEKVDRLVTQIIDNGLIRQTVFSSIENHVYGEAYLAVEQIRQDILKDGVDTLLALTDNNVQKLTDKLENIIISDSSSPITSVAGDIKAVELLTEIARTEPQSAQKILQAGEANIAASLEKILLSQPAAQRTQEVSSYIQEATGNPVRQFEALDVLKDGFKNPQTILLAEELKDMAAEKLQERISEIPDADTQNTFTDKVIGSTPQDLKAVTQIEADVAPPQNAGVVEVLPIVQKVEDIKINIEQNIIDTYKDKPEELAKTDFFTHNPTPDVVDVKVAQDLENALSRSSDVQPEVIAVAKQEEARIIDTFVANISKPEFQISVVTNTSGTAEPTSVQNSTTETSVSAQTNVSQLAAETLNPIPETLTELVNLKQQLPPAEQAKIDVAINIEVGLIQDHLVNQVHDLATFETYIAQITENPTVEAIVARVGGQTFQQAIEQKTQIIDQQVTSDQTQLTTAVTQVQQEIFATSKLSPVEQTLPQPIQQEIQQIKQEVPVQQIPSINVTTETAISTTATAQTVDTTPISTSPVTEKPQASAPAPAPVAPAPEVPVPQTQPAPEQPAAPAAPAAPGL